MQERERKKFVRAWKNHANDFYTLAMTPSLELSKEVRATVIHLDSLIEKVADDKIRASKRKMKRVV
jgi:hypothetical protein